MADNRTTCLGILAVFILSAAALVMGGLHYLGKFGSATGVVVDQRTGDPVADATVELYASFPSTSGRGGDMPLTLHTETGDDGTWVLRQTVGGSYRLTVRHPDFATYKREGVALEAEEHTDLGTVKLGPRASPAPAPGEESPPGPENAASGGSEEDD